MDSQIGAPARCEAICMVEGWNGAQPILRVSSSDGTPFAAKWRFGHVSSASGNTTGGILACRTSGTATVTLRSRGACTRRRPTIGAVTYIDAEHAATWSSDGTSEAWHIYLPNASLRRHAEFDLGSTAPPRIKPLFGTEDPWLRGYFQMLASEFELSADGEQVVDPLFAAQAEHLAIHHLLRFHSEDGPDVAGMPHHAAGNPLRAAKLKQVQDYVAANLKQEIDLAHLAAVACMSPGHFLRGFRIALGMTPYRYVLEQRVAHARELLRTTGLPIADIAVECGFRTPSHLSAKFRARVGTSPSRYRANP